MYWSLSSGFFDFILSAEYLWFVLYKYKHCRLNKCSVVKIPSETKRAKIEILPQLSSIWKEEKEG